MKKTLSVILVAVMLLSTLVSLVVPAAAADGEGEWIVKPSATSEDKKDDPTIPPLPGYKYTDKGFTTVAPENYENFNPRVSVVSKDKFNIKDFSMTVEISDYSIVGDNWFSFTVWTECNGFAQGTTSGEYGYGWTCLIRDSDGDGVFETLQEFDQSKSRFGKEAQFTHVGTVGSFMKKDENAAPAEGDEDEEITINCTLTFAIVDGKMSVNGVELHEESNNVLKKQFSDNLAYVGATIHSSDPSGKHKPTITITEVNGEKPTGTDSAEPENKERVYGPMIDSSTVAFGKPAVYFDATYENEDTASVNDSKPSLGSCRVGYSADGKNYLVTADGAAHYWQFSVKDEITYNANDFRMVAFLFKNLCTCTLGEDEHANEACAEGETIKLRYCAGETTSPDNISMTDAFIVAVNPEDENGDLIDPDNHYLLAYAFIDDTENYVERIHALRMDITEYTNYNVEGKNQYEIVWGGAFASGASMLKYVFDGNYGFESLAEYLVMDGYATAEEVAEITNVQITTEETTTKAPTESTTAPAATTKEETTTNAEGTTAAAAEEKSGCGSVVSMGAIAIVTVVAGTGIVTFKKKKED